MTDIQIRDARTVFFQTHVRALDAIRSQVSGPARARAFGFYGLLCQIANEQHRTGERRRLIATRPQLAERGLLGKDTLSRCLNALEAADTVRVERRVDRSVGSLPSLIHLCIQDGFWLWVSVATANRLREAGTTTWLADLGLLLVLLEFCDEQKAEHGGHLAHVSRAQLARRSGYSRDRLDDRVRRLEDAGVLIVTRRRREHAGHLPSVYEIIEPAGQTAHDAYAQEDAAGRRGHGTTSTTRAAEQDQGSGETGLGGRQTGMKGAAGRAHPPSRTGLPGRQVGCTVPAERDGRGGDTTIPHPSTPPHARAGTSPEHQASENNLTPQPPSPSSPPDATGQGGGEGRSNEMSPERLCEELARAWAPVLGGKPSRDYERRRRAWLSAAREVLADHPVERVRHAMAYMTEDRILSSEAVDMPGFARVIDRLLARAHATGRERARPAHLTSSDASHLGWPEAFVLLRRAVDRHGRNGRAAATTQLREHSPAFDEFIERVGWGALCGETTITREREWRAIWEQEARKQTTLGEAA